MVKENKTRYNYTNISNMFKEQKTIFIAAKQMCLRECAAQYKIKINIVRLVYSLWERV